MHQMLALIAPQDSLDALRRGLPMRKSSR